MKLISHYSAVDSVVEAPVTEKLSMTNPLEDRLRDTVQQLRKSKLSVNDVIPMLLEAADRVEQDHKTLTIKTSLADRYQTTLESIIQTDWYYKDKTLMYGPHAQKASKALALPL